MIRTDFGSVGNTEKKMGGPIMIHFKSFNVEQLEGKSGASSRGNSSSNSVY